jgi:hypothetical protein
MKKTEGRKSRDTVPLTNCRTVFAGEQKIAKSAQNLLLWSWTFGIHGKCGCRVRLCKYMDIPKVCWICWTGGIWQSFVPNFCQMAGGGGHRLQYLDLYYSTYDRRGKPHKDLYFNWTTQSIHKQKFYISVVSLQQHFCDREFFLIFIFFLSLFECRSFYEKECCPDSILFMQIYICFLADQGNSQGKDQEIVWKFLNYRGIFLVIIWMHSDFVILVHICALRLMVISSRMPSGAVKGCHLLFSSRL